MVKKQKEKEEEKCEECDREADERELVDVVLNGALATLCRRCAIINQAIVIEKPSAIKAVERIARIPGLAEELRRNMPNIASGAITIGDLRKLQEKKQKREGEERREKEKDREQFQTI